MVLVEDAPCESQTREAGESENTESHHPVQGDGDDLIVYHTEEFVGCTCGQHGPGKLQPTGTAREWMRFSFPRQNTKRRLCVADFFRGKDTGEFDVLGVQLVTVGDRAAEVAQEYFQSNRYQDYLFLYGFGVESA